MSTPYWQRQLAELKRRGVFHAIAVYGAVAFAILQGVDVLIRMDLLQQSSYRPIGLVLLGLFPIAVILTWVYDRTAEGTIRTAPASPEEIRAIVALPARQRVLPGVLALIGIFLLLGGGWYAVKRGTRTGSGPIRSVAVLPFLNIGGDESNEYFSMGLAEELLNSLAKVKDLKVAARTSAFAYKGKDVDIREVGNKLGVASVVEGSVRRSGDRIRITAQLIQVSDGFHLWSETYDRSISDIFAVQDEISRNITEALQVALAVNGNGTVAVKKPTENLQAYQLYLQARHLLALRTAESLQRAIELFTQVVQMDPRFADAVSGLAAAYRIAPGYARLTVNADSLSDHYATAALALNPDLAEAHAILAVGFQQRAQWLEAEREHKRSLELEPMNSQSLLFLAQSLIGVGKLDEALKQMRLAYSVDPASGVLNGWISHVHRLKGDADSAVFYLRRADELGWGAALNYWCRTLVWYDRYAEAGSICTRADQSTGDQSVATTAALRGRAMAFLDAVRDPAKRVSLASNIAAWPDNDLARYYAKIGDTEKAMAALDRLSHEPTRPMFRWEVVWWTKADAIRKHPRFAHWAETMNLVEYWKANGFPPFCSASGASVQCH
jgi:adenylate cyclase